MHGKTRPVIFLPSPIITCTRHQNPFELYGVHKLLVWDKTPRSGGCLFLSSSGAALTAAIGFTRSVGAAVTCRGPHSAAAMAAPQPPCQPSPQRLPWAWSRGSTEASRFPRPLKPRTRARGSRAQEHAVSPSEQRAWSSSTANACSRPPKTRMRAGTCPGTPPRGTSTAPPPPSPQSAPRQPSTPTPTESRSSGTRARTARGVARS